MSVSAHNTRAGNEPLDRTAMRSVLFVYFKAAAADDARVAERLARMCSQLQSGLAAGLRVEYGCRPQAEQGMRTWLESYARCNDADLDGLQVARGALFESLGLSSYVHGECHFEHFALTALVPTDASGDGSECA